jgi:lambda family phage portal protein
VERDPATLRPLAYYMRTVQGQGDFTGQTGPLKRISAEVMIHGFRAHDEDQPRGIPWAHAGLVKLKMLDEYDRAELTAARDEACTVREYSADRPANAEDFVDLTDPANATAAQELMAAKEPGQAEILPFGYKSEVKTPQHPNREVTAFKASMLKDVASALGVEYSNFCNDWAGVSFSSVRSGTISERDMRTVEQDDFIADCKTPMFLFWLESFLSLAVSGDLPKAKFEKFAEHEFRGRRWMWVDPMKDIAASEVCVKHGWKTNTQVAADLGTDYEDNLEGIKREQQKSAGVIDAPLAAPPMDGEDKEQDNEDESK